MDWYENHSDWAGLNCAFAIDRIFETPTGTSNERSYYISSLDLPPSDLLRLTREHWKVEAMHYQLDVSFSEDDCRILSSNGQKTFNIFRKMALAFHKNYIASIAAKTKPSVKNNMFQALLSCELLTKILGVAFISA
jgi:predicted transposase YbfD/YdcC